METPIWRKRKRQTGGSEEINGSGKLLSDRTASSVTSSCSTLSARSSSSSQTSQVPCGDIKVPIPPPTGLTLKNEPNEEKEPVFPSPMYEELETNIPRTLMSFSDQSFPPDCQLFPKHEAVKTYIDEYAKGLLPLVKFETQVQEVSLLEAEEGFSDRSISNDSETINEKWSLKAEELKTGRIYEERYDAVIMANGHYSVPFVPDINGAKGWNEAFPGTLSHSKTFRTAEEFRDKVMNILSLGSNKRDCCLYSLGFITESRNNR